jgi:hypothetical protein
MKHFYFTALFASILSFGFSQNQMKKWCFGNYIGLDFMSQPPTQFTTAMNGSAEGITSLADAAGNLLFYTNGITIWNKNHQVMANGSGLEGGFSTTQAVLAVPQPGSSNNYYLITISSINELNIFNKPSGIWYSVVDMSLAATTGSVVTKNMLLSAVQTTEKLSATLHCNGKDIWILSHDWGNNNFRAYLLTATGLSTTAVVSAVGSAHSNGNTFAGGMKFSPNGRKLISAINDTLGVSGFELFDFDNATGLLSNPLKLSNTHYAYGCEFSPDGTKLYGTSASGRQLLQWDLCAGSPAAVAASVYTVYTSTVWGNNFFTLQNTPDGKMFMTHLNSLGVIQNPNVAGAACNYSHTGLYIGNAQTSLGLPNFMSNYFKQVHSQYTYTTNCQQVSFTGIAGTATLLNTCTTTSYVLQAAKWDFGDPASGQSNTTTVLNASHFYSAPGTYTAQLVLHYKCSSDTLRQVISIQGPSPSFSLSGKSQICSGESTTLSVGPAIYSYSWSNAAGSTSIAVSPTASTVYSVTATNGDGCTTTKTHQLTVSKCLGVEGTQIEMFFRAYPSPASKELFIESDTAVSIEIYDCLGSLVKSINVMPGISQILIDAFSKGVYFIKVGHPSGNRLVKFVKTD